MLIHGIRVNNDAVPYTGTIRELNDTEIIIQIASRLGVLKLPRRWLICEHNPKIGDEVKFLMSYIEMKDDKYEKEENDRL